MDLTITLNDYQRANLLQVLKILHGSPADTGDWCGELRWMLEDLKNMPGCRPNVPDEFMRELLNRVK